MTTKATLLVLACAGCRLHFDELAPGDGSPGVDAATMQVTFGERATAQHQNVTFDTFVDESSPMSNNGADEGLSIAGTAGIRNHTLIRFDLTALPPTARVATATLELERLDFGDELPGTLSVVALAQAWIEGSGFGGAGDCSWNTRDVGQPWATPGGTAGPTLAGPVMPTASAWRVPLDAAAVQAWIADPTTNHGLMIEEGVPAADTHYHFHSRDSASVDLRPLLTLDVAR